MTSARRVVFPQPKRVTLEAFELPDVEPGTVRARALLSLMSTGTENTVLNERFESGSHWSRFARFPFHPGYAWIGEVEEVGAGVERVRRGGRVALRAGHSSHHVVPEDACTVVPDNVAIDDAVWFALAKITNNGARAVEYRLGERVLVIGGGPIGQMSVRWAVASGARVALLDPIGPRLAFGWLDGAVATIEASASDAEPAVREVGGGALPSVVVDATGNAATFAAALALAGDRARVLVIGDTGYPTHQHLTSDVIIKGLTIVGAHDMHNWSDPGWPDHAIYDLFFALVQQGRFPLHGLITHRFAPGDCADAYALANERRGDTLGIVFDWASA